MSDESGAVDSAPAVESGSEGVAPEGEQVAVTQEEMEELEAYGKKYKLTKAQVKQLAQKGLGADTAFREASKFRAESAELLRAIQKDPFEVLKHIHGDKLKEIAEDYVYNHLKYERMSPEEKKNYEDALRLKAYEEQEKKQKEDTEQKAHAEQVEHYKQHYTREIAKALDAAELPKTEEAARRCLGYLQKAFNKGIKIDAKTVGELVMEDYQRELGRFGDSKEEMLMKLLGEKTTSKISKAILKQHQEKNNSWYPPTRDKPNQQTPVKKERHYITEDEWDMMKRR